MILGISTGGLLIQYDVSFEVMVLLPLASGSIFWKNIYI
jgi:hypothetical protein